MFADDFRCPDLVLFVKLLPKRLRNWLRRRKTPVIAIDQWPRDQPHLHRGAASPRQPAHLLSQLCRFDTLDTPTFRKWVDDLGEPWRPHRKLWELAFICQALAERDMLRPGRSGLGFAVGAEKLPALFASLGCQITATDLPADDDRRMPWAKTGQWVGEPIGLNAAGLCDPATFQERVVFRPVDMNQIPSDLTGFDFTWSTCSFEHCGSLELGLAFLRRQMDCLAPGGIAIHTTEFNLSSNDTTIADGSCVIYRLCDIEQIVLELTAQGHQVEPLDLDPGSHSLDRYVESPPYCDWPETPPDQVKHLRLNLMGYATTSVALVIRKAA